MWMTNLRERIYSQWFKSGPKLQIAWQHRHISNEQIAAADRELRRLEVLYRQAQAAPDDPRKANALAQMERRSWELGYALNARTMLNKAWRDVQKRASKVLPLIDPDATDLRADIAFQMKQGQGPAVIPEEKPNFGIMSDREFKDYTKRNYGF